MSSIQCCLGSDHQSTDRNRRGIDSSLSTPMQRLFSARTPEHPHNNITAAKPLTATADRATDHLHLAQAEHTDSQAFTVLYRVITAAHTVMICRACVSSRHSEARQRWTIGGTSCPSKENLFCLHSCCYSVPVQSVVFLRVVSVRVCLTAAQLTASTSHTHAYHHPHHLHICLGDSSVLCETRQQHTPHCPPVHYVLLLHTRPVLASLHPLVVTAVASAAHTFTRHGHPAAASSSSPDQSAPSWQRQQQSPPPQQDHATPCDVRD